MNKHIISTEDLEGEYKTIIASSSKEQKRLTIITTSDKFGRISTNLYVTVKDKIHLISKDLKEAINKYNLL